MRPTYLDDCSSETEVGSVARIQKLPSSSLGMNSRPRELPAARVPMTTTAPIVTAARLWRSEKANSGW